MTDEVGPDEAGRIDRRSAIKKGVVGAAVAGVAWTAPRVEGLSLRPNYAAAVSLTCTPGGGDITISRFGSTKVAGLGTVKTWQFSVGPGYLTANGTFTPSPGAEILNVDVRGCTFDATTSFGNSPGTWGAVAGGANGGCSSVKLHITCN